MPAQITRVPKTPKFLEGVVNLRGDVLPVVDQRRRFDLPHVERNRAPPSRRGQDRAPPRGPHRRQRLGRAARTAQSAVEPPPELTDEIARLVRGVINLEKSRRIVLLLDPTELLTVPSEGVSTPSRRRAELMRDQGSGRRRFRAGPQTLRPRSRRASPISRSGSHATALEALKQLEEFQPNVITLDVQMPQMNGLECLDRIMLERPSPVVMVSSLTAEGAEATLEALRLGAVDFVLKPEGAVSLRIDEFAPDVRGKDPRSGRGEDQDERAAPGAGAAPDAAPGAAAAAAARDAQAPRGARIGRRPRARRHLDGRPAGARSLADAAAATFPWPILVAQHMPATLHRSARQAPRRSVLAPRGRGAAADGRRARLRLHRPRRRGSHRVAAAARGSSR